MLLARWLKLQKWFEVLEILQALTEFISCCVRANLCSQNANILNESLSIFWYHWCLISNLKNLKSVFDSWWFVHLEQPLKMIFRDNEWRVCPRFDIGPSGFGVYEPSYKRNVRVRGRDQEEGLGLRLRIRTSVGIKVAD